MATYTIELTYKAVINVMVEAEDEPKAIEKAREEAEKAYMEEFYLTDELNSKVIFTDESTPTEF